MFSCAFVGQAKTGRAFLHNRMLDLAASDVHHVQIVVHAEAEALAVGCQQAAVLAVGVDHSDTRAANASRRSLREGDA